MKILLLIFVIGVVIFAITRKTKAQTNDQAGSVMPTDTAAYTLDINDRQKSISNPNETDLRKALASLRSDEAPYNLVLLKGGAKSEYWIQVTCTGHDAYVIQIQEGDEQHQFQAAKDLSTADTLKLLLAFLHGDADWKKQVEWKPL